MVDLLILITVIILAVIVLFVFVNLKLASSGQNDLKLELKHMQTLLNQSQNVMHETLRQSDKNVTDTLQKSYQALHTRLDSATKVISDLKQETGKFSEIGRSMSKLQEYLNSPKLRGNLGEQILTELVSQIMPSDTYTSQYRFSSGETVDMAISTHSGIIPVDAKFPLENFNKMVTSQDDSLRESLRRQFEKDIKKHIKDISQKYIKPSEKTVDFAIMYIPSESVYYELMTGCSQAYQYAHQERVFPVSPTTFYAFLRTVLLSFEGQRLAKEAQAILTSLRQVQKSSGEFSEKLSTLNRHITHTYNTMQVVSNDYNLFKLQIDDTRALSLPPSDPLVKKADN